MRAVGSTRNSVFRLIYMIGSALGMALLLGCASKIPTTRGLKLREAAAPFDAKAITFSSLDEPSEPLSLADLMAREGYDALLLTFGSKACASCNRKAEEIQSKIIGKHPFFLTKPGLKFGIVGINTDPDPGRLRGYFKQFPFIKLSDPSGKTMLEAFMEPGEQFRVPLTVLVSKEKIFWRILADESPTAFEIMEKVSLTLASPGDPVAQTPPRDSEIPPTPRPQDPSSNQSQGLTLAHPLPDRWEHLTVTLCDGQEKKFSKLAAEERARGHDLVLQVIRQSCEERCQKQHQELKKTCQLSEPQGACSVWTLVETEARVDGHAYGSLREDRGVCTDPAILKGGRPVLDTFKSLFDWKSPRSVDADGYVALETEEKGPQVFIFEKFGRLRKAQEGYWEDKDYQDLKTHASDQRGGVDFPLYQSGASSGENGMTSLSQVRQGFDFTVLAFFQTDCGSCEKEFKQWSAPSGLMEFCRERPGFCQVIAVENRYRPQGWTLEEFYRRILYGYDDPIMGGYLGFQKLGISIPLLLDPVSDEDSSDAFKNRIHDGYLIGISKDLKFKYRKAVFDSEGKLRALFVSPDDEASGDPLEEFLKREYDIKAYQTNL